MWQGLMGWAGAALLCLLCSPSHAATQEATNDPERPDHEVVARLVPENTGGYQSVPWGPRELCSPGSYVIAFQLKVEPVMLFGDFTALNGLTLYCFERETGLLDLKLTSTVGRWGLWGEVFMCTAGFLIGVQMRVEQPWEANGDNSAVNNLAVECQYDEKMTGDGTDRGQWGGWQRCPEGSAICGLSTQVMQPQFFIPQDDVSLVSAAFYCCTL